MGCALWSWSQNLFRLFFVGPKRIFSSDFDTEGQGVEVFPRPIGVLSSDLQGRHSQALFFSQIRFCYRHSYLWIASKLTSLSGVACHIFSPSEYETCLLILTSLLGMDEQEKHGK